GLAQAGSQGMADRFTYLPGVGLLVAVVWSVDAAVRSLPARRALAAAAVGAVVLLAVATRAQLAWWADGEALLRHTIALTRDNWFAHGTLGDVLAHQGRTAEARAEFLESLRIEPDHTEAAFGAGVASEALGRPDEAATYYRTALRIDPGAWKA